MLCELRTYVVHQNIYRNPPPPISHSSKSYHQSYSCILRGFAKKIKKIKSLIEMNGFLGFWVFWGGVVEVSKKEGEEGGEEEEEEEEEEV